MEAQKDTASERAETRRRVTDQRLGAALMTRDPRDLTQPARYQYDQEQQTAIRRTVAKDCNDAEFVMFLELAARYKLDPFARQIWAAKMGGQNDDLAILVGRDGLLSIAERYDEFVAMESDVVVEGDKLTVDPETTTYVHEWGEQHLTGTIIGAWAQVWRSDREKPIRFYARWDEYAKPNSRFWQRFKSAMILKCAQSMALKQAFSITGLLVEEEVADGGTPVNRADTIEWGNDPLLAAWLQALVARANDIRKNAYRPQKVLALLRGRTDEDRHVFAQELVDFIGEREGDVPSPPEGLAVVADGQITWHDLFDSTAEEVDAEVEPDGSVPSAA
jgi:phage recombination protein Bet